MELRPDGALLEFRCNEPTSYIDGSPLADLASIRFYWQLSDVSAASGIVVVPASSPAGGGQAVASIKLPILPCQVVTLYAYADATTTGGHESDLTAPTELIISRMSECAPPMSATLSVTPGSIAAGNSVTATWSDIPAPTTTDWIGLYAPGVADGSYLAWLYPNSGTQVPGTTAAAGGACSFQIPPSVVPGPYELRLFTANNRTRLATSGTFTVTAPYKRPKPPKPPKGGRA